MPDVVTVQGTAVALHRKASSDCCGAKVDIVDKSAPPAEHAYTCTNCGNPTNRVLSEPTRIPVAFGAEFPAAPGPVSPSERVIRNGGAQ